MKAKRIRKIFCYIGYVLCAAMLILGIIFMIKAARMGIVPTAALVIGTALFLFLSGVMALLQRWLIGGIISKILMLFICAATVVGCIDLSATQKTLAQISGIQTKIDDIHVYVLAEHEAETLEDLADGTFGILQELDRTNTDLMIADIEAKLQQPIAISEYEEILTLINDLYEEKIDAVILNSAYLVFVSELDGYTEIETDLRSIAEKQIETPADQNGQSEKETADPYEQYKDYLYGGEDVFTVYLSGIDTNGSPNVNRNSDVNILLTVNTTTRQILMISTPRDYYVPLSISDGVKDKLTHAGCYGVDVSVDTLEMLYGINIDYYMKLNFAGFVGIIDALGGVDVYSDYAFTVEPIKDYVVGVNHLNGIEALAFARERYSFAGGDRQRGKNQMAVIQAIVKKAVSTDMLLNYTEVLSAVSDCIATNMSYETITDLVKFQLSDMREWDMISYSVDGSGSTQTTYSLSMPLYVMVPNEDTVNQAKTYLEQIYNGEVIDP